MGVVSDYLLDDVRNLHKMASFNFTPSKRMSDFTLTTSCVSNRPRWPSHGG
jgi:hypothetical protein